MRKINYSYNDEQLTYAVQTSISYRQIHQKLGLHGYNYYALKKHIAQLELDDSHLRGRDGIPLSMILVENSDYLKTGHLKHRLFREGLKSSSCEICHITDWLGKTISFHLHHINGNYRDNRLFNLQILCPNCHSQTDNYGHKNKGNGRPR